MSAMVDVVFKMTLDMFVKKAQSALSDKLKGGDLNAQKLRKSIMSNLQNIKSQLVGLAHCNLRASASDIEEGFRRLYNLRIDNVNDLTLNAESWEKLLKEVNEMKTKSVDDFNSAMKLFKNANREATMAFNNEGLTVEDRVLATKLRVQSRLLLSLEKPIDAKDSCRFYLEKLHDLSPVVETFRSHLEGVWIGKVLSFFTKEKPQELVLSVSLINVIVFTFLKRFTIGPITLYDWPNLAGSSWTYNPLIPARTIHMELQNAGVELPYLVVFEEVHGGVRLVRSAKAVAVNSDGDLVLGTMQEADGKVAVQKLTMQTNEIMNVGKTDSASVKISTQHLLFLAIDSDDNMYLLTDRNCTMSGAVALAPHSCELFTFDSKGDETHHCQEVGSCRDNKAIVPTPDGFVVVLYNMQTSICEVEFYKNNKEKVQRTCTFPARLWENLLVAVTNNYQVIAVEERGCWVHVYEKDGQPVKEFDLHEPCVSTAFNHLTEEVCFVTQARSGYYHLSTYVPETGERRHCTRLTLFGKGEEDKTPRLTSHCKGPMALISSEYVVYIQ